MPGESQQGQKPIPVPGGTHRVPSEGITPELVAEIADRVWVLLARELRTDRERAGGRALSPPYDRGGRAC
jgi:hypothetical protein